MQRSFDSLVDLLQGRRFALLTGAGLSTESGIPDYRGPETRRRSRSPIQYRQFLRSEAARRRYWSRSLVGYPRVRDARPNDGHRAIADLQARGHLAGLITQNVDRLHRAAGSHGEIELHGALADVRCLDCGIVTRRDDLQSRLLELNPGRSETDAPLAPDGDADVDDSGGFVVPTCECGGAFKPDVVFFGESVPRDRVERSYAIVESADALVVAGSSLAVFSGYRFVRRAEERGIPVAIVNLGETRGDPHATVKVAQSTGEVLPALAHRLAAPSQTAGYR